MRLGTQQHDVLEVRVIYVGIYSEQALEYYLNNCLKVAGEGNTERTWEDLLIVELVLYPRH